MMKCKPILSGVSLAIAALALGACQDKAADTAAVAQGSAPEGTISDELPNLDLLANDAPLADPADVPPVEGATAPSAAEPAQPSDAPQAAPAPAPTEPALEGSIAQ